MAISAISTDDFLQDNAGSDSDSNSTDDGPDYYQPISAVEEDSDEETSIEDKGDHVPDSSDLGSFPIESPNFHCSSNGYGYVHRAQNGMEALHLNGDEHETEEGQGEEAEETEASDSAIAMAFRENERRRNAPITTENAMRIMDAMRGVSFGGLTPDWADRVSEDRWVDQLQRLRQTPPTTINTATTQN